MRTVNKIIYFLIAFCFVGYSIIKVLTYNVDVNNFYIEEEIEQLENDNEELLIQLTTQNSREEVMKKYPELDLNKNIYYLDIIESSNDE